MWPFAPPLPLPTPPPPPTITLMHVSDSETVSRVHSKLKQLEFKLGKGIHLLHFLPLRLNPLITMGIPLYRKSMGFTMGFTRLGTVRVKSLKAPAMVTERRLP